MYCIRQLKVNIGVNFMGMLSLYQLHYGNAKIFPTSVRSTKNDQIILLNVYFGKYQSRDMIERNFQSSLNNYI